MAAGSGSESDGTDTVRLDTDFAQFSIGSMPAIARTESGYKLGLKSKNLADIIFPSTIETVSICNGNMYVESSLKLRI